LASVRGAEHNGKLVLLKGIERESDESVLVSPAELSERDVNLIFANYLPFSVTETQPGVFKLIERESAPALAYATLAQNSRVKTIANNMQRRGEEKEQKKREKAAAKSQKAKTNAGASSLGADASPIEAVLQETQPKQQTGRKQEESTLAGIIDLAIAAYLHEMAPAEKPYQKPPEEIRLRQVGSKFAGATQLGAERGSEPGTFVAKRRLNKDEVASRLRSQSVGWWANLTRIVNDNNALPISFTQANSQEASRYMIDRALELYGIKVAGDTPEARLAALNELRSSLLLDAPREDIERDDYRPTRLIRRAVDEDIDTDSSEMLVAQLNPSRAVRPPRRPRPPRRSARYNPASNAYTAKVTAGFSREDQFEPEGGGENADYTEAPRAFPDAYSGKGDLKPELAAQRIAQHGQYVRFGRRPSHDSYEFGEPPSKDQAGLSIEEARAIHKRQVDAYDRRRSSSIPASSALCAVNRRQKLKGYRPPSALMRFGKSGFADKKVVIWVSPASAAETRVMMYRRNTHIDCDFVASMGGMSLGQLLALALQDVLLWLAQRDTRKLDTYVYVGRVGEGKMRLAWEPGNPLTYSAMLQNLGGKSETISDYDAADDTARYRRAAEVSYVATAARAAAEQAEAAERREQEEVAAEAGLPPSASPTVQSTETPAAIRKKVQRSRTPTRGEPEASREEQEAESLSTGTDDIDF
jgi:hypothetical protein